MFKILGILDKQNAIIISLVFAVLTVILAELNACSKASAKKHFFDEKSERKYLSRFRFIHEFCKCDKIISVVILTCSLILNKIKLAEIKIKLAIAFLVLNAIIFLIKFINLLKNLNKKNKFASVFFDATKCFLYSFIFLLNSKLIRNVLATKIIAGFLIGAFFFLSLVKMIFAIYQIYKDSKNRNFKNITRKIGVEILFSITKISLISLIFGSSVTKAVFCYFNPILLGLSSLIIFFLFVVFCMEAKYSVDNRNLNISKKKSEKLCPTMLM